MDKKELARAIAGHYTQLNIPQKSRMDRCTVAADKPTGFIYAAALVRPTKTKGITTKSVLKKFKTKTFSASIDHDEVRKRAALIGWELRELIDFIIPVLQTHK